MAAKNGGKRSSANEPELVFVALGGLGEIGMNVYLYGIGPANDRRWLMVDLGITFPHELEPGVDVVLPDLRFIAEQASSLAGIVLTHAHEDHIGAVIDLWPQLKAPIYATPFTAGMLKSKLAEFAGKIKLPITEVPMGGRFQVGPFAVELVTMSHSIPEPSALLIETPLGRVFHTGDWKLDQAPLVGDPANEARIAEIGAAGVDALVCDSTNAFRDGRSPSETEVAASILNIIKGAKKRVAVTTFASNVARVKAVADAAQITGRRLVVAGRAMHRVIQVAKETGYLPETFRYLDQDQFGYLDREDTLLLCTGSQGEPRAAMARVAESEHPHIELVSGDLVIFSSRTIPGNEKSVSRVQNLLARSGCDIITDSEKLVHVTGHPRRDELRQMYGWLRPRITIPMHGEARHLRENARIAREAGVREVLTPVDGEIVKLAPGAAQIIDEAPVGRLFRDGNLIVPSTDGPVRERRKLSFVGIVVVSLVLSSKGELLAEPEVALDGVPQETAEGRAMEDIVYMAANGTIRSIPPGKRRDLDMVEEAVRRGVRAAVDQAWGKKPIVKVLATMVEVGKGK
jgi:ribonuclease J